MCVWVCVHACVWLCVCDYVCACVCMRWFDICSAAVCVTRKLSARSLCVFFQKILLTRAVRSILLSLSLPISHIPICAVRWINFEVLKDYRNCTIGQIRLTNWREWKRHDKFNKESEMVEDGYHHDFGDNKFPHYLGEKTSKPD